MPINTGEIVEGIVNKITEYGAFIDLSDGKRGLVHISEIADTYVKNIGDYIKERQKIKVKVLSVSGDGRKIDLSIKQVSDSSHKIAPAVDSKRIEELHSAVKHHTVRRERLNFSSNQNQTFEEKLARFLKSSEERQTDIKRNIEAKRGGGKYIK